MFCFGGVVVERGKGAMERWRVQVLGARWSVESDLLNVLTSGLIYVDTHCCLLGNNRGDRLMRHDGRTE